MALNDIPALNSDHPLFSWADWPVSYNALVSNGAVNVFQKETWNAIVDTLHEALTAAGLGWDAKYTTVEGAKITEAYGPLTAAAFNSVRHNIDHPAPIGWAWARDESFRGYVGREDFVGYYQNRPHPTGDFVYPEYLIELVRKLNLLIEIMRGTANIGYCEVKTISRSRTSLDLTVLPSVPMEVAVPSKTENHMELIARPSVHLAVKAESTSDYTAELDAVPVKDMDGMQVESCSQWARPELYTGRPLFLDDGMKAISRSIQSGELDAVPVLELPGMEAVSESTMAGELDMVPPIAMPGMEVVVRSAHAAELDQRPPEPMNMEAQSVTAFSGDLEQIQGADMAMRTRSASRFAAALESAWYPPEWVGDGWLFHQVYDYTFADGVLEVV